MDYLILGGDARFACLAALLERRGRTARRLFAGERGKDAAALAKARNVILNFPLRLPANAPGAAELVEQIRPDATLWLCGPGRADEVAWRQRTVDLWADEQLQRDNATLTAEGAIFAAMGAAARSLRELPVLILGWGRIARALTELLVGMGAPVRVASRSGIHRNQARERGAEAVDTMAIGGALPGRKLIFNTAPALVLDEANLLRTDWDAMLIDLASPPYGIDLRAAWALGIRAWREPGIPGRYCPESAAEALLRAMDRAEERGDGR